MSRSAGPGSPLNLRCRRCVRREHWRDRRANTGTNWEVTGETKPAPRRPHHARGVRSSNTSYRIRCKTCGYEGWSTHKDAERAYGRTISVLRDGLQHVLAALA